MRVARPRANTRLCCSNRVPIRVADTQRLVQLRRNERYALFGHARDINLDVENVADTHFRNDAAGDDIEEDCGAAGAERTVYSGYEGTHAGGTRRALKLKTWSISFFASTVCRVVGVVYDALYATWAPRIKSYSTHCHCYICC